MISRRYLLSFNKQRPDGLYVTPDALLGANQKRTIGFALENRLPSMYSNREGVNAGGLMYYGADAADSYRRVAYLRGQDFERRQACGYACRTAEEI